MSVFTVLALAAPSYPAAEPTGADAWISAAYVAFGAIVVFILVAVLLRKSRLGRRIATIAVLVVTIAFILIGTVGVTIEARVIGAREQEFALEVSDWLKDDYNIVAPADGNLTAALASGANYGAKRDGADYTIAFTRSESNEVVVVDGGGAPLTAR